MVWYGKEADSAQSDYVLLLFSSLHRELASHRSGLPREGPCYPDTKTNFCPYTNDQMIQRLKNVTLLHEPGKEPSYRLENNSVVDHFRATLNLCFKPRPLIRK